MSKLTPYIKLPDETVEEITKALKRSKKVRVAGLGIFEIITIGSRPGRNPVTSEIVPVPAYKKVKFRATDTLKRVFNK